MCKYCQDNDIREKKEIQAPEEIQDYQIEFGPGHAILEINHDPSLYIQMEAYDKMRKTKIAMIIAPAINYCPWCDRKL